MGKCAASSVYLEGLGVASLEQRGNPFYCCFLGVMNMYLALWLHVFFALVKSFDSHQRCSMPLAKPKIWRWMNDDGSAVGGGELCEQLTEMATALLGEL